MRIRDHLHTRIALALAAATVVSATAATVAIAGGAAAPVTLVGAPAILDSGGTSGKQHSYWTVVRVRNSSRTAKTVMVQFDGLNGSKVFDEQTSKGEVAPGEGLAVWYLSGPAGMRSVRARIVGVEAADHDDTAVKILGGGKFHKDQNGCWMTIRVENRRGRLLSSDDALTVYFIALRGGKIVSFGSQSAEDIQVAPHAKDVATSSLAACATGVNEVRGYSAHGL